MDQNVQVTSGIRQLVQKKNENWQGTFHVVGKNVPALELDPECVGCVKVHERIHCICYYI